MRLAADVRVNGERDEFGAMFALGIEPVELVLHQIEQIIAVVVLHQHHRNVVQFDRIRQRHQRAVDGADGRRFVVIDPVADIFDARGGEQIGRFQRLRQAGPEPADRAFAGELFHNVHGSIDHRSLVRLLVDGPLLIGVAHELPAGVARFRRHARIVLTDARIGRERRLDAELLEQLEETPAANAHAIFVKAPVHHVRHQRHAGRRRQLLARHWLGDVPDLVIDDSPEHDARLAGQFQWRPVDDGRIVGALARDHGRHEESSCTSGVQHLTLAHVRTMPVFSIGHFVP